MSDNGAPAFTSRYYRSDDGPTLHYREYAGPNEAPYSIICLPGLTRNARDFEDLAPYLARRYRVLCVDFRGRGLSGYAADTMSYVPMSYVNDLRTLFSQTGLSQAVLIGTSLDGLVATMASAMMPTSVLGLVLNDVGPEIDPAGLARIAGYVGKTGPINTWQDAADAVQANDQLIYPGFGSED